MNKATYKELLKKVPPHNSPEFIDFLRKNNDVEYEDGWTIIIRNCKYWTKETPWLTAFSKYGKGNRAYIPAKYKSWEWLKKAKSKQTIKLWHIHLIKK